MGMWTHSHLVAAPTSGCTACAIKEARRRLLRRLTQRRNEASLEAQHGP